MGNIKHTFLDDYNQFGKCLRISNGSLEIIATLDIGPRIIRFSLEGDENILGEHVPVSEHAYEDTWKIYGGHRVWHSPEAYPRSYMPDNLPLEKYEVTQTGVILYQAVEPWVQIQKVIEVQFKNESVLVHNRLVNKGAWPIEIAVWSLSIGSKGGVHVAPMVQRNTGLLPNRHIVMWPDSTMNDPRAYWGKKYIIIDNNETTPGVIKYGYPNEHGWAAYFNNGCCFIKKYCHQTDAKYPDFGCSWEAYSAEWGIELESLSPLTMLKPGKEIVHTDEWYLFGNIRTPGFDEVEVEELLQQVANKAAIELPVPDTTDWKIISALEQS